MNGIRSTFLIFIWSLPILVGLGLLSLFNYNKFTGFWFLSPYDYPFTFTIALFISLTSSATGLWVFRQQSQDFNLIIVICCIFLGCLLRLSVYFAEMIFSFILTVIILLCVVIMFKLTEIGGEKSVYLFSGTLYLITGINYYTIPLILVFIACKFPISKPSSQAKRFRYASPALGAIVLFSCYTFGTSFYVTPGLVIPHNLRHIWGGMQNPRYYEQAKQVIAKVKSCPLIIETIGELEAIAVAEKLNYLSMLDNDSLVKLSFEVVGKRGNAIIKDCATDTYCPKNMYADTTKLNHNLLGKKIYYAQCNN